MEGFSSSCQRKGAANQTGSAFLSQWASLVQLRNFKVWAAFATIVAARKLCARDTIYILSNQRSGHWSSPPNLYIRS